MFSFFFEHFVERAPWIASVEFTSAYCNFIFIFFVIASVYLAYATLKASRKVGLGIQYVKTAAKSKKVGNDRKVERRM